MISSSGRFVMAFNGEIYNHLELRAELEGMYPRLRKDDENKWRGHSDTETLLTGFEYWGIEATLAKTVGMFAIALWNVRERTLHLARESDGGVRRERQKLNATISNLTTGDTDNNPLTVYNNNTSMPTGSNSWFRPRMASRARLLLRHHAACEG